MFRVEFRSRVEGKYKTYKVCKEVAGLSHSKLVLVAEPGDEVDVGLDPRRVRLRGAKTGSTFTLSSFFLGHYRFSY